MPLLIAVASFGFERVLIDALSASSSINSIGTSIRPSRSAFMVRTQVEKIREDTFVLLGDDQHRLLDGVQRDAERRGDRCPEIPVAGGEDDAVTSAVGVTHT